MTGVMRMWDSFLDSLSDAERYRILREHADMTDDLVDVGEAIAYEYVMFVVGGYVPPMPEVIH